MNSVRLAKDKHARISLVVFTGPGNDTIVEPLLLPQEASRNFIRYSLKGDWMPIKLPLSCPFFRPSSPNSHFTAMDFEFEVRYFTSKVNFMQGFCVFELCGKLVLRDMFCLMCFHIARVFSRPTCVSAERPAKCPLKNNLWIINFCSNDCYHLFANKMEVCSHFSWRTFDQEVASFKSVRLKPLKSSLPTA